MGSILFVTREGEFQRAGLESVDEAEIFEGRENKITLIQSNSIKFHCTYLLHDFPFDSQVRNKKLDFCLTIGLLSVTRLVSIKSQSNLVKGKGKGEQSSS